MKKFKIENVIIAINLMLLVFAMVGITTYARANTSIRNAYGIIESEGNGIYVITTKDGNQWEIFNDEIDYRNGEIVRVEFNKQGTKDKTDDTIEWIYREH